MIWRKAFLYHLQPFLRQSMMNPIIIIITFVNQPHVDDVVGDSIRLHYLLSSLSRNPSSVPYLITFLNYMYCFRTAH